MNKHQHCNICHGTKFTNINKYQHAHLVQCCNCSFVFAQLIPDAATLSKHYAFYPLSETPPPLTIKRFEEILQSFRPFNKTNNLIDIGCGDGHFLAIAQQKGWNIFGTEMEKNALRVSNRLGATMCVGDVDFSLAPKNSFDVVTCFEYIEHVSDPLAEAKKMFDLLRPGGICYITTPNFSSLSGWLSGKNWNIVEFPEHLSYFTPRTIKLLYKKAGLLPHQVTTSGISISRIKESNSNAPRKEHTATIEPLKYHELRQEDEVLRNKIENNLALNLLKRTINGSLNLFSIGDSLKAYFIKP
ncbi:MAG: hypothetical protein RIQ89_1291 [Bacteroidota bacterium]|jgi:2-polyprenyl-3-methyl-5-hydroxy-6-metoxy-1,4-benzoquinol methylase